MKTPEINNFYRDTSGGQAHQFSIETDPLIMQRLSSNVYERPIEAIVRELGTNAYDAHIDTGLKDRPFDVELPTAENSNFTIRDYGPGLSIDELKSLYITYAKSSRRSSNDHIGSIGIGSKSPYAYTQQFTVTSYHGGEEITALCYRDEQSMPVLKILNQKPSSAETGLKVSFSVNTGDHQDFHHYAAEVYAWFDTRPNVTPEIDYSDTICERVFLEGDDFKLYNDSESQRRHVRRYNEQFRVQVLMGNILYNSIFTGPIKNLILKADIGDVEINMSRETIQDNERNRKFIQSKYKDIHRQITQATEEKIQNIQRKYQAYSLVGLVQNLAGHSVIPEFRGEKIKNEQISLNGAGMLHRMSRYSSQKGYGYGYFDYSFDNTILWADKKPGSVKAARTYCAENDISEVTVLHGDIDEFCRLTEYPREKIKKTSDYYKPTKRGPSGLPRQNYSKNQVLEFDDSGSGIRTSRYSKFWKTVQHDPLTSNQAFLWVEISNYKPKDDNISLHDMLEFVDTKNHKIYGVKKKRVLEAKKAVSGTHLKDYLDNLTIPQDMMPKLKFYCFRQLSSTITSSEHSNLSRLNLALKRMPPHLTDYFLNAADKTTLETMFNEPANVLRQDEKRFWGSKVPQVIKEAWKKEYQDFIAKHKFWTKPYIDFIRAPQAPLTDKARLFRAYTDIHNGLSDIKIMPWINEMFEKKMKEYQNKGEQVYPS